MSDRFIGTVRCPDCGLIQRVAIQSPHASSPEGTTIGDAVEIDDSNFVLSTHRRERGETVRFMEPFVCGLCGRRWAVIEVEAHRVVSITAMRFADALQVSHYVSETIGEEFEEATGLPFVVDGEYRSDWLARLEPALLRRVPALGPRRDSLNGFQGELGRIIERAVRSRGAETMGRPGAQFVEAGVAAAALSAREPPAGLRTHLTNADFDDSETWFVEFTDSTPGGVLWWVTTGANLRSLVRQARVYDGAEIEVAGDEDFPCGAIVNGTGWRLTSLLRGDANRGVYRAMLRDGRLALTTLVANVSRDPGDLRRFFEYSVEGVAALSAVAVVEGRMAIVEELPDATSLADVMLPWRADEAARIGAGLALTIRTAAQTGVVLGGIRPETTFFHVSADERAWDVVSVAPRGEPFMAMQKRGSAGSVTPYDYFYTAPEVLAGKPATSASDVFAACAVIAHLASGEHPFEGLGPYAQLMSITGNKRTPFRGPASIARIVDLGLRPDPSRRPSADELHDLFAEVRFP